MTKDEEEAWTKVDVKRAGQRRCLACVPLAKTSFVSRSSFAMLDDVVETCLEAQCAGDSGARKSSPRADTEGQDGSKVDAASVAEAVRVCETIDDLIGSGTHAYMEAIYSAPQQPLFLEATAAVAAEAETETEVEAMPPVSKKETCATGPARSCTPLVDDGSPQAESENPRQSASRKQPKSRKKQQAGDNEARETQEADDKGARKKQQARNRQARSRQHTSDNEVAPEQKHIAFQVAAQETAVGNRVPARSASVGEGTAKVSMAFAAGLFAMAAVGGIEAAAAPDPNARRLAVSTRQPRRQHNTIQHKTQAGPAMRTKPRRTPQAVPRRNGR